MKEGGEEKNCPLGRKGREEPEGKSGGKGWSTTVIGKGGKRKDDVVWEVKRIV